MRSDHIAGLQVLDRTDDFSVFGEQTIAHTIDAFGVAGCEALFEHLYAVTADEDLSVSGASKPHEEVVQTRFLGIHAVDEKLCYGGGGLEGFVSHHIENTHIACVPDTG